jgi:protein SCO1
MVRLTLVFLCVALLLTASCGRSPSTGSGQSAQEIQSTNQKVFQVKGVIVSLKPGEKTVNIKHEAIPDYMPGMTMPFEVKSTNELAGLAAGDAVAFRLTVTDTDGWIDQITKVISVTNPPTAPPPIIAVPSVGRLQVGDPLPEYHFTNQLGQAVSTSQFRGQALAVTFLFTRCPFPTFCPRMSNNFEEAQQALLAKSDAPTNWHLLTISFDPEFDRPEVLKNYAEGHHYNPEHWTFATGSLADITTLGDQFGLIFQRENGSISHNLRTIVLDASGKVQKVFEGNEWKSDALVDELTTAATRLSR